MPTRRRLRDRPLLLALVLAAALLLSVRHFWPTFLGANESIRYFFVVSLVEYRTVTLDAALARYHSSGLDRASREGHAYLDKAPATSLLALPIYWVATRLAHPSAARPPPLPIDGLLAWMTLLACTVPALAAVALLAQAARRAGLSERGACVLLLALLLGTPLGLYSTLFFGHAPAAAALAAAFALLQAAELGAARTMGAGALAAAAIAFEYTTAPLAIGLGVLASSQDKNTRGRNAAAFAAGALPILALLALYHDLAFGSPLATGYRFKADPHFAQIHGHGMAGFGLPQASGLFGITLSRERGLFFLSPWLLLAIPGLVWLMRQPAHRRSGRFILFACASSVLLVAGFADWPAGNCVGPRHLVMALPFFAYAAVFAPRAFASARLAKGARALGLGLGLASLLQLWFASATFPYFAPDVPDPVYTVSVPLLLAGHLAPGPLADLHLPLALQALLPIAVATGGTALLFLRGRGRELALGLGVALLYLCAMAASSPAAPPRSLAERRVDVSLMGQ